MQARKPVNSVLLAGIATVVILIIVVVGGLMNAGKSGKTLLEQIELGKTSLVDVEKYFDKNNLGSTWGKENTWYGADNGIWPEVPDWNATGCEILVSVELNIRFPNAVPKPAWLEVYREFMKDDWAQMYFIGVDSNGVPYLVTYAGYLYHYNGTEVERLLSVHDVKYNPKTNKALIYDRTSGNVYYESCVLEDLYTTTKEMSVNFYEDYESGIATYNANDKQVSEDEYDRVSSEMSNRFGTGGYLIEQDYPSVDEAYQAYISNKDNT